MISGTQKAANAAGAIATGLLSLIIPIPLTTVQQANKRYYLPRGSSYTPGWWKALPFQVGVMNCMGNDLIRTINLIKFARVDYTRMLLEMEAYFIEHESRNSLPSQPTNSAAGDFMKSRTKPTIRDIPASLELAPWFGRKRRDNTLTLKRFSPGVGFWCLGGATAENYREKSVDVVCYDELSPFEPGVEKEGPPALLEDKRIEGSVWPKSIRGSTPKIRGSYQIEKTANESAHFMRFYVSCPHCGKEQCLEFGDDASPFGLKWGRNEPESAFYLCEHHGCVIHQSELDRSNGRWICEDTGMWTRDDLTFFSATDNEIPSPHSVAFHIWTAHSPFTTWIQIVYDWLDALEDPNGLKTFVNTTLDETWEEAVGEKLDHRVLVDKVVRYTAAVPPRVVYLTAGIDSQRDRFEMYVRGWVPGEEAFLVDRIVTMGCPDEKETLLRMDVVINKKYRHANEAEMIISRVCWDIGRIGDEIVYQGSKKHGVFRVLPVKGASAYSKPMITMPKTRNQQGIYLCEVGTDTAEEILYACVRADLTSADEATSYAIRFPDDPEIFSQTETQRLATGEFVGKWEKGKMRLLQGNKKWRNEMLDCLVYAYAILRVSVQRWQLDLVVLVKFREEEATRPALKELAAKLSGGVNGCSR